MTAILIRKRQSNQPNPYIIYLNSLAPSGRRSMASLIQSTLKGLNITCPPDQLAWHQLKYEQLIMIRQHLRESKQSVNTMNTALSAFKGIAHSAFQMGQMNADDYLRIKSAKHFRGKTSTKGCSLTAKEVRRLRRTCGQSHAPLDIRDAALLDVFLFAGLRRAEVVNLRCQHYRSRTGELEIVNGKGLTSRFLTLPKMARLSLRKWLKIRGKEPGFLFCAAKGQSWRTDQPLTTQRVYALVKQRAKDAGIGSVSPHDLRRTFITQLLTQGTDFNTVRLLAGHQDMQTTTRYDQRSHHQQVSALKSLAY